IAAFPQHVLRVAIADRIATIPAHRPQDHITLEMAPLEIRHRSVRPISAKHAQASRFLQQSQANHCGKASKLGNSENNGEKDAEGEGKVSKPFPARIAKCLEYFCNSSHDVTHVVPYFQSGV